METDWYLLVPGNYGNRRRTGKSQPIGIPLQPPPPPHCACVVTLDLGNSASRLARLSDLSDASKEGVEEKSSDQLHRQTI